MKRNPAEETLAEAEQGPPSAEVVAISASLRGSIDFAADGRLYGCAWEQSDLDRPLEVEVFDGETPLARATANVFRPDLALAGVGDGCHGFVVDLPEGADPERLRAVIAGTDIALERSPFAKAGGAPARLRRIDEDLLKAITVLHKRTQRFDTRLREINAALGALGKRAEELASRKDLAALHSRLVSVIQAESVRIAKIEEGTTRIEGFLDIDLGQRIRDEIGQGSLPELTEQVRSARRATTFLSWLLVVTVIGALAVAGYPWAMNWLGAQLPGLFQ